MTNIKDIKYVERLKNNYSEKTNQQTKIEELKKLNKKVKQPALVTAYTYGTAGALVLGTGMCLAMGVIGNLVPLGVVVGLIGIAMVATTYPIYDKILSNRKAKYASEIIAKSDELLNNKGD